MRLGREVNQIAAAEGHGLYVLCDDGTLWLRVWKPKNTDAVHREDGEWKWEQIIGP